MKFAHDSIGEYIECEDATWERDEKVVNRIFFRWLNQTYMEA